jgi:hypothetical protein
MITKKRLAFLAKCKSKFIALAPEQQEALGQILVHMDLGIQDLLDQYDEKITEAIEETLWPMIRDYGLETIIGTMMGPKWEPEYETEPGIQPESWATIYNSNGQLPGISLYVNYLRAAEHLGRSNIKVKKQTPRSHRMRPRGEK